MEERWNVETNSRGRGTPSAEIGRKEADGFVVLPKRWIVECTFAWLQRRRRHSKDYERNPDSSVAMIYIVMTKNVLNMLKCNALRI